MTRKTQLLIIAALILIVVLALALWVVFSGEVAVWSLEPRIRALKAYVDALPDVNRIDVIYRPSCEWLNEPDSSPEYEETTLTITDPAEIQQIMNGFVDADRFAPYWTQCGFYIKLNLYNSERQVGIFLVGFDDCKSFTTENIHAVGTMANDYFYREYVKQLVNTQ
ncbi:MAG: hypothetical protein JXA21_28140 [Anaerolineae bacterium]|nr:hypothetical protein [Anaerolineae bacterium]